jgi:RNA polymerase sigma-70 factor (ECF subfamily)
MDDFELFYAATQRKLLRAVVAVTGDPQDAQDCLQEAYTRAAMRWRSVARADSPEAWVRRVALNLAFDGHRRRMVRRRVHAITRAPAAAPGPDVTSVDVVRAVRALPREEQEVIIRHHLLDLSVADTARELGRPEGTVKAQLVRARSRLTELLSLNEELSDHE